MSWASEAWDLRPANEDDPSELLEPGIARGKRLGLDIDSFQDVGSSNIASIQRGRSTVYGKVIIKCARASHRQPPHDVREEARILAALPHDNVCALLNAYRVQDWYILVEPYYPLTLRDLLDEFTFTPGEDAAAYMSIARGLIYQMCLATAYLEEQQIAHRDICPSNWVVDHDGTIKLIDFSVAMSVVVITKGQTPERLEFQLGTGPYRPPELLFGCTAYDPFAVDRWMLGATIAEFFTSSAEARSTSPSDNDSEESCNDSIEVQRPRKTNLFGGGMSDFTLIGSIFRTLGTPTLESWPDAALLPDFGKFSFRSFTPMDLQERLPLLPESERDAGISFIAAFLKYTFSARQSAQDACTHPFLRPRSALPENQRVELEAAYQEQFSKITRSLEM